MPDYSQNDLLRVAKRVRNAKRSYLLVNPLQGKHIPVSPARSLEMMNTLGGRLAEAYPGARLVIGFAETATAIGAAVASRFPGECVYLHTTREETPQVGEWVLFSEEHSHAVEQKLCGDSLARWLEDTESVILVDDEISTGKTLINMVRQLRERYPALWSKKLVAASLLNRVSPEHEERLAEAGIRCEYLVKVVDDGADEAAALLQVEEAGPAEGADRAFGRMSLDCGPFPDPREGVRIQDYLAYCQGLARAFLSRAGLAGMEWVVVLGTEECMYPALVLGRMLEERGLSVKCHATTRSPIGICGRPGYPITSGKKLSSFYGGQRDTYIYNISPCDGLIVVSDAPVCQTKALNQLAALWEERGCKRIFFIQGGSDVWYL